MGGELDGSGNGVGKLRSNATVEYLERLLKSSRRNMKNWREKSWPSFLG